MGGLLFTMIYLHSDQTPGVLAFLLGTNMIICLEVVTVSEEVEIHGGDNKTLGGGFYWC